MLTVNTNMLSLTAQTNLDKTQGLLQTSMQRLSSGLRINSAKDDAAGIAIASRMESQINGLGQAVRNANNAVSLVQTIGGAMSEVHDALQRMRELALQAADGSNASSDRQSLDAEFQALKAEIGDIASRTQFNGANVLDGSFGASLSNVGTNLSTANGIVSIDNTGGSVTNYTLSVSGTVLTLSDAVNTESVDISSLPSGFNTKEVAFSSLGITVTVNSALTNVSSNNTFDLAASTNGAAFQVGANAGETLSISSVDVRTNTLGINSADILTVSDASSAIDTVTTALNTVLSDMGQMGAVNNRLDSKISNLNNIIDNTTAAQSRIMDADFASETANMTKAQILQQAGISVLAQANQQPQMVLKLLQ
ncbi:MAG: flagellin [Nitrospiraceae bacterium]|nr:flagellin [Nitrospiraceae bacterium]